MKDIYKTPVLMALLSALLFGAATPASKLLLAGLTPFQLAGLLYLGAAAAVAPAALKRGGFALPRRADRHNQLRLFGAILFGGILGPVALLYGLQLAEAASVSLWLNMELVATAVFGVLIFKDRLGLKGWLGVAVALMASIFLGWVPGNAGVSSGLLVLLACLCWGLDNHLTALIDGNTPSQSTFWKGCIAGTVNLVIGMTLAPLETGFLVLAIALVVGGLSYGASIVLYIRSAQSMGATRAQVIFASAPFFGVLLSALILGETFSLVYAIATPLFVVGIVLLLNDSHTHTHAHEVMDHEHFHSHDDNHHNHAGLPPTVRHSHRHTHEQISHKHPHWPDIHHRHSHSADDE